MHWACGNTHAVVSMFTPEVVLASVSCDCVADALLVPAKSQMLVDFLRRRMPPF